MIRRHLNSLSNKLIFIRVLAPSYFLPSVELIYHLRMFSASLEIHFHSTSLFTLGRIFSWILVDFGLISGDFGRFLTGFSWFSIWFRQILNWFRLIFNLLWLTFNWFWLIFNWFDLFSIDLTDLQLIMRGKHYLMTPWSP